MSRRQAVQIVSEYRSMPMYDTPRKRRGLLVIMRRTVQSAGLTGQQA